MSDTPRRPPEPVEWKPFKPTPQPPEQRVRISTPLTVEQLAQALCDSSSHLNTLPHAEQRPCDYHRKRAVAVLKHLKRAGLEPLV